MKEGISMRMEGIKGTAVSSEKMNLSGEKIKELKARGRSLNPIVRIGKSGLNEGTLAEIRKHLKKKGLIKIKLLKQALESYAETKGLQADKPADIKKTVFRDMADSTGSVVIGITGFTALLYRPEINDKGTGKYSLEKHKKQGDAPGEQDSRREE
ncbi:MAG: YhbY family RNA-binding protein [Candidatus Woesearchaeota archaeon]